MAKVLGFVFTFILPLLLSRILSVREFGVYKQAFLVVATAQSILPLGFSMSAFYFLPREPERRPQVVLNILLFNLFAGSLAFAALLIYPQLLQALFGSGELVPYAPLIGALILSNIFAAFLETVATANQDVKYSTTFIITAQFTKGLVMVAVALFAPSIPALILASTFQSLVQIAILCWYLRSRFPGFHSSYDWSLMKTQFSYAVPLGVAGIVSSVKSDLHSYYVANVLGPVAFAIYAVGCLQLPILGILRESITSVVIPRISYLHKLEEHREILLLVMRGMRKLAIVFWGAYGLMAVAGYDLLIVLYTDRYVDSWAVYQIQITTFLTSFVMNDPVVRAYPEYRYYLLKLRLVLLGLLIAAFQAGVLRFGLRGAIAAFVASVMIERVMVTWKSAGILKFRRQDLTHLRDLPKVAACTAGASLCAMGARFLVSTQPPLICLSAIVGTFCLAYPALLWLLRVPSAQEMEFLRLKWGRVRQMLPGAAPPATINRS